MRPVIAIHGGAGTLNREAMSAEAEVTYHAALRAVLEAGQAALAAGATAVDAVTIAVGLLEDCPLFNAGHGAVFTHAETHELDAAVMDGATRHAGAVACVSTLRSPVRAARAVMEHSEHVLFVGEGAEAFGRAHGLEFVDPSYFSTDARREQLHRALATNAASMLDHDGAAAVAAGDAAQAAIPTANADHGGAGDAPLAEDRKFGTVGAVALDSYGHIAAATSTGGMTNKQAGRVGDAPLIGAGTYADDRTAAVSCTGSGEMFIRVAAAYDVCARMAYAGETLAQAAEHVVMHTLPEIDGRGGLIAVDREGNVSLPFNTEGMYRGVAYVGDTPQTAIFR
jgi:beta-aspartyl-peptidase (threonine type)